MSSVSDNSDPTTAFKSVLTAQSTRTSTSSSTRSFTSYTTSGPIAFDTSTPPEPRKPMTTASTTDAAASASSTTTSNQNGTSSSTGQTIGITVGVVLGACILMGIIFVFCWRRKSKNFAKKYPQPAKNKARKASLPGNSNRHTLPNSGQRNPSAQAGLSQPSAWPRYINPEDIGVALDSPKRDSFIKRLTQSRPKTRSILPISAPMPLPNASQERKIQTRLTQRLPAEPPTPEIPLKHISDATTIRSSCNPPTPAEPPVAMLRPLSSSTSLATTFEEDKEYFQAEDAPPLPTFTAVEIPVKQMNGRHEQNRPARLNLEAGIKKSINKAMCNMPMTPRYDNGNVDVYTRSRMPPVPRPRLKIPNIPSSQKVSFPKEVFVGNSPKKGSPSNRYQLPAHQRSPPSPWLVPDRESSLEKTRLDTEGERLQKGLKDNSVLPDRPKEFRPPPLSIKKTSRPNLTSPIKNLTYPQIPTSASETSLHRPVHTSKLPSKQHLKRNSSSAEDLTQYARTFNPRTPQTPRTPKRVEATEGPMNTQHIARQFRPPTRIEIPHPAQGKSFVSPSDLMPPKALLTPNRTESGDLILTVDMQQYETHEEQETAARDAQRHG